ncbi:MAG: hypothetical protein HYS26_01765 [Candidatus Kaiserbacteria bacterium]|nr:MAG: hypothetical protein HYS26_01765 [Candidatus Kaiserbacteria bacterium]
MNRTLKIGAAWTSIAWTVCYVGVGLIPQLRDTVLNNLVHTNVPVGANIFSLGGFLAGLVLWNVIVAAGIWLWFFLAARIKS